MADESIWKKEISIGRKKKPQPEAGAAAPADAGQVPFWKKEIGGKKKQPVSKPVEAATAAPTPAAATEAVPFWKKEIGGKKKQVAPAAAEASVAPAADAPAPKVEPVPFWKKEITLGGAKSPAPSAEAGEPAGDEAPFWKREVFAPKAEKLNAPRADEVPFWKREVSLGRKQQQEIDRLSAEAASTVAPDPAAEIHEPIKAAEAAARALIADPNAEIEIFFQARHLAGPADDAEPVHAAEPEPEPAVEPAAASAPVVPEPAPASTPSFRLPEPVADATPPGLEPLAEPPALELPVAAPPAVEAPAAVVPAPVVPTPVVPTPVVPEPVSPPPAPAPVVHAPVPAAELPPLPGEDEPKVSFWKKEISFSSKPKPQTIPAAPGAAASAAPAPTPFWKKEFGRSKAAPGEEVSIWKKEISFSRKPKQAAADPVTAATAPSAAVPEPNVPFWKKEIGGKKKQPAAAAAATTAVAASAAEPKVPFWKKEIGGKKKQPAAAKPTRAKATGPSVPFWKRELSLKSLKDAKASAPSRAPKGGPSTRKKTNTKAKRLVGLKVGASQLAAARVSNNGVAELLQVARQPLEQGIVVSGELRDPDALAAQLKIFFAKNKLPKKNVRLGIASNRIGVRIFDVVGIHDEHQLANAIQFRAQEALPIPLDEAVLDYHVLAEGVDAEGQPTRRILLVVAYRELVDRYVNACKKAGITLLGVDLEAFALLRALAAPRAEDEPAKAALVGVAIGYDRSTFAVSDGRTCEFTRVLEWGGAALNIAMARALDLAPSEVEAYKRALMLDGPAPVPEGLTQEQWAAALDAVRRQLQSFARELVSSLQFYQNQPGSLGIGEIVLAGGTAHMPGLAEELQRLIGVQVRVGDPLARVKVAKGVASSEQVGSLAVAIGLGIED